jgi:type VI secretion system protein ImpH
MTSERLLAEPWAHDLFLALRQLESENPDKPRLGDSAKPAEDLARLSQDPYLAFPASTLGGASRLADGRLRLDARFLGMFGPQGALPLSVTEEACGWVLKEDDAFPRFVDVFQERFLQLFFRAWADARPIAQHDRPGQDRFITYIGAMIGVGTPPYRGADSLADAAKLEFAGLLAPRAKSASRLKGLIAGLFKVRVELDEFVGSWLAFDRSETTALGTQQSRLGQDIIVGSSMFSVQDKFRLRVFVRDFAQYQRFLPVGDLAEQVADAVYLHLGDELDWDLELAIPAGEVVPVRLGQGARLGWTSWMSPNWSDTETHYRKDTRFHLAERFAHRRKAKGADPS